MLAMLRDPSRREAVLAGLAEVRQLLGPPGAISRVADLVTEMLGGRVAAPAECSGEIARRIPHA